MSYDSSKSFINAISGREDSSVTFQTFNDDKSQARQSKIFSDTFEAIKMELKRLNDKGHGVFLTINETDLKGRKKGNIVGIRSFFVDLDGTKELIKDEQKRLPKPELAPSIIVETKRGYHLYWLCENGVSFEEFEKVQATLISFYHEYYINNFPDLPIERLKEISDSSVNDRTQVLRIPGFNHMKNPSDPFEIRLIKCDSKLRYTAQNILEAFPEPVTRPSSDKGSGLKIEGEGRNVTLTRIGGRHIQEGGSPESLVNLLLKENSQFENPLDDWEVNQIQDSLVSRYYTKDTLKEVPNDLFVQSEFRATTWQEQKEKQTQVLNRFLEDPGLKLLHLSEPCGFGKTATLIGLVENHKCVFLTYSNNKAKELESDVKKFLRENELQKSILRVFGEEKIKDEAKSGELNSCINKELRRAKIVKGESAFGVCKNKCAENERCPYFNVTTSAKESEFDILIGTLGELQNVGLFRSNKIKLEDRLLILDEDGHTKIRFDFTFSKAEINYFCDYLSYRLKNLSDFVLDNEEGEKTEEDLAEILIEVLAKLHKKTGLPLGDAEILNTAESVKNRKLRGISVISSTLEYGEKSAKSEKLLKARHELYDEVLGFIFWTDSELGIHYDKTDKKVKLTLFPRLDNKIILADATATQQEVKERFEGIKVLRTYDIQQNGIIKPVGEIHQIIEHLGRSAFFFKGDSEDTPAELLSLNTAKTETVLRNISDIAKELGMTEPVLLPIKGLVNKKESSKSESVPREEFLELAKKYGFLADPKWYHGALRGLNELEKRDVIVFGSTFPMDHEAIRGEIAAFGDGVEHSFESRYLVWNGSNLLEVESSSPKLEGAGWISSMGNLGRGESGRKKYLEGQIQSLRSRFYHHNTKTLVFSPYPLTDFGIAVKSLKEGFVVKDTPEIERVFKLEQKDEWLSYEQIRGVLGELNGPDERAQLKNLKDRLSAHLNKMSLPYRCGVKKDKESQKRGLKLTFIGNPQTKTRKG